ncbi:MAG: hypothetical protein VX589_06405 [Myxococcota bacterium]|nr:hypothetical protein [Myxococcota bacterium]
MSDSTSGALDADILLKRLMEDAGETAVQRGAQPSLTLQEAVETLDSLIDETNLDAESLRAYRLTASSVSQAMDALFAGPVHQDDAMDLDGLDASDGIFDDDGSPMHADDASIPPQLAGAERPSAKHVIRKLDDDIDFWTDLGNEPSDEDD